ncbi:MAG: hypothetical protein FJX75_15455 [Armatimonadetes bacterium]|nr:hypothetical protein [Armatimonadota bacterium]
MCRACAMAPLLLLVTTPSLPQGLAGRDDIWADFSRNDVQGLQAMHAAGACDFVERDLDGVHCVATDGRSGKHWLCFDVPRAFITSAQPARYTLVIQYLDSPADGLVTVRYHAARDAMAQAIRFQRQGSGEWRELVLSLTDAVFMNGTMGCADFAVHGFTDTGDPRAADVYVSGVWLSKRTLDVSARPGAIPTGLDPAQQTCTVRVLAYGGAGGLAPDGTVIRFSATGGTVEPEVATKAGVAEAKFIPDGVAGTSVVTADWDIVSGWTTIAKVTGDQPLQQGRWGGLVFDEAPPADLERVNAATSFADVAEMENVAGGKCLQLHYCFQTGAPGQPYITCPLGIQVPGRPQRVLVSARGDGSPHHFQVILQDAQGTMYTIMSVERALRPDWQDIALPVESWDDCWGPHADGVMDFPVTIVGVRFVCLGGNQLEGDIYLSRMTAQGLFPTDSLAEPPLSPQTFARRTPDGLLIPAAREPLGYIVENLAAMQDANQLVGELWKLRGTPAGRNPEAIEGYRRLVELKPDAFSARATLAMLLFKAGDLQGALPQVEAALKEPDPLVWRRLLRARILDGLGRRDEASKEFSALADVLASTKPDPTNSLWPGVLRPWADACKEAAADPIPFYKRAPNASPGYQEITDLARWSVQCNRGQERLPYAIDRNPESFWSIGGDQATGDWFLIDLGEVVLDVARVVLDDDGGTNVFHWDLPGEMRIEGSVDGAKWEQLAITRGTPRAVIDATWDARPLRFIRATLTENTPKGDLPEWRVYEAYVYRKAHA